MVSTIKWVRIQCGHCAARFAPPIAITDRDALEKFLAWGGIVDCVKCHHFAEVNKLTVTYADDDGSGLPHAESPPADDLYEMRTIAPK